MVGRTAECQMSSTLPAAEPAAPSRPRSPVVNDFSIQVATVNGSGSQTANLVLLRSIFQMGVPVSGKNLFPSNIAGLPTWYTIRANHRGYISRKKEIDFLVAMNPETAKEDVLSLEPGRAVVYDEPLKLNALRDDLIFYPVPFDKIVAEVCPDAKLRRLVQNMVYDGVLSQLLSIDLGEMEKALDKQLGKKPKAMALNMARARGRQEVRAPSTSPKRDPYRVERMNKTAGQVLVEGNAAAAMGCMFAGVTVVAWYPITPSSSLPETLIGYMRKYRMDKETGKATFAIVQAEDEIAALGMVVGAGWAGARAMTSTSGPGISLMSEFAGLAYYAEMPAVVFDIQRVGPVHGPADAHRAGRHAVRPPSTRTATRATSLLLPGSVEECYEMAMDGVRPGRAAADDRLRDERPRSRHEHLDVASRSRIRTSRSTAARCSTRRRSSELGASWGRYKDVDGDGIPWRIAAGHRRPGVLHARLRPQRDGAVHRAAGRLRQRTSTGWRASSTRRRRSCRRRSSQLDAGRQGRHHRVRVEPLGGRGVARPAARGGRPQDVVPAAARVSVHAGRRRVHPPARSRLRRRAEPRRARC